MASIQVRKRRDGSPVFRVLFRHGGQQTTETFDSFEGAEGFKDSIDVIGLEPALARLAARKAGRISTIPTLAEYARRHVEGLSGIEEGTRVDYLTYITRDLEPTVLGQTPVDTVTRQDIATWVTYLHRERGLAGKSIRNRHSLVSSAFTAAVMAEVRPANPCIGVRLPRTESHAEMVFLDGSEFALFLGTVDAFWQPLVTFLYSTGARFGEATALRVRDVDLGSTPPTIRINMAWKHTASKGHKLGPPKTFKGRRTIGLTPQMVGILRSRVEGRGRDEYVFVNHHGDPVRHNNFYDNVWSKARNQAEPLIHKRPRIHDARHSCASNLIRAGVPLNIVQRILGHESIQTTVDLYGHVAGDAISVAAQAAAMSLVEAYPELEQ